MQPSKAEADRKRTAAAVKKKAELALDGMENELLDTIKHHPDLRDDLRNILQRARERILDEEGNLNTGS